MSTLHLSPEHLSAILWGCTQYQVISKSTLTEELNALMMELFQRNAEEYNENYPKDQIDVVELSKFYRYTHPQNAQTLTAIQLYKLALCYQYNSSGSPKWEGSKAKSLSSELMTQTILSLPEYQSAKWDI